MIVARLNSLSRPSLFSQQICMCFHLGTSAGYTGDTGADAGPDGPGGAFVFGCEK